MSADQVRGPTRYRQQLTAAAVFLELEQRGLRVLFVRDVVHVLAVEDGPVTALTARLLIRQRLGAVYADLPAVPQVARLEALVFPAVRLSVDQLGLPDVQERGVVVEDLQAARRP